MKQRKQKTDGDGEQLSSLAPLLSDDNSSFNKLGFFLSQLILYIGPIFNVTPYLLTIYIYLQFILRKCYYPPPFTPDDNAFVQVDCYWGFNCFV